MSFRVRLTWVEDFLAFCFVLNWYAKIQEASITEFCSDFGGASALWGLLPAWRTPNWGHQVASNLGPFSLLNVTQTKFLESPCLGRPRFGDRLADPEKGPLIENMFTGGAAKRPQF